MPSRSATPRMSAVKESGAADELVWLVTTAAVSASIIATGARSGVVEENVRQLSAAGQGSTSSVCNTLGSQEASSRVKGGADETGANVAVDCSGSAATEDVLPVATADLTVTVDVLTEVEDGLAWVFAVVPGDILETTSRTGGDGGQLEGAVVTVVAIVTVGEMSSTREDLRERPVEELEGSARTLMGTAWAALALVGRLSRER